MFLSIGLTIFLLLILFLALLFFVCGKKGFRSLLSMSITIVILIAVIIPLIVQKYNPALVVFIASIPIVFLIIYLTEGFNAISHLSFFLTVANFFIISLLINFSISFSNMTGITSDISDTVGGQLGIDLPKLLVAAIMLGTLGALVEMIVTQVGTVMEFAKANPNANKKQIYKQSYNVGVIHLGSIINTLFLIYAGVLLPTLILFSGTQNYLYEMLNYEPISSEIVRIIIGTIGLIIAMPTSTFIATQFLKRSHKIR